MNYHPFFISVCGRIYRECAVIGSCVYHMQFRVLVVGTEAGDRNKYLINVSRIIISHVINYLHGSIAVLLLISLIPKPITERSGPSNCVI